MALLSNSSCDEHLAVGQQRRRVQIACGAEAAGGGPGPAGRIVQFRARRELRLSLCSSCDEHLAVGQQRRRVKAACGAEAAGGSPGPAGRIVEFRAREIAAAVKSSCDEHLAVGQQRRRVVTARAVSRLPVAVQVPLAGSYSSALARLAPPAAASTMPLASNVAVWPARGVLRLPVTVQVPPAGLNDANRQGSSSCEIARVVLSAPGCALFGRSERSLEAPTGKTAIITPAQQRKRLIKARGLKQAADRKVDFFFIC